MAEIEPKPCRHERLGFSSGGFYVQCADCNVTWVARKSTGGDLELDYDRGPACGYLSMHDLRIAPTLLEHGAVSTASEKIGRLLETAIWPELQDTAVVALTHKGEKLGGLFVSDFRALVPQKKD